MKTAVIALFTLATTLVAAGPPAQAAPVGPCTAHQVRAVFRGGDAAMSTHYGRIVVTNTSSRSCSVRGFGGLSYVGHGDGTLVGAPADRDPGTPVRTVVLRRGESARSEVSAGDVAPYDDACTRVAVDGWRLYLPGETSSLFVPGSATGCAQSSIHLLGHQAFTRTGRHPA